MKHRYLGTKKYLHDTIFQNIAPFHEFLKAESNFTPYHSPQKSETATKNKNKFATMLSFYSFCYAVEAAK